MLSNQTRKRIASYMQHCLLKNKTKLAYNLILHSYIRIATTGRTNRVDNKDLMAFSVYNEKIPLGKHNTQIRNYKHGG